jgi:hypothetical protein
MLSFQDEMMSHNCSIAAEELLTARVQISRISSITTADHSFDPKQPVKGKRSDAQHMKKTAAAAEHKKKPAAAAEHKDICLPPLGGDVSIRDSRSSFNTVVQQPSQVVQWNRTLVTIVPGHSVPMVGTRETMQALESGGCTDTACVQCEAFLYCIKSARMVICPLCRFISPLNDTEAETETLGLGLTVEQILEARRAE